MTAKSSAPQNRHSHISALGSLCHSPLCSVHRVCIPLNQQQKLGNRFEFHFPQHQQQCSFVFFLLPLFCLLLLVVLLQLLLLPPQVLTEIYGMCRVQSAKCAVPGPPEQSLSMAAGCSGCSGCSGTELSTCAKTTRHEATQHDTAEDNTAQHNTLHSRTEQRRAEQCTARQKAA